MASRAALAGVVVVSAAAWMAVAPRRPEPALEFDHARHAQVSCTVCHRGVESAARATLPTVDLCRRCHATAPRGLPAAPFEAAAKPGAAPVGWTPVTKLGSHVYFSHRRHVALARLECASCHGAIGASSGLLQSAPVRLDMSACLSCHRREGVVEDCTACHR